MNLTFLLLLFAAPAHAANLFEPVAGDLSIAMLLQPVFGSLFGGSGEGALGDAIELFNTACLTVGGLLVAYTMVFGTMQTAHDGQVLGKTWSSMWVPIRLAVGTAALVPVKSYCVAQLLVAWVAVQGIGLADAVWETFATSAFASQKLVAAAAPTANVSRLGFGMLRSAVCMRGFARLASEGDVQSIFEGMPRASGTMTTVRRYGVPGLSATQCGGVVGSQASGGAVSSVAGAFGISTGAAEKAAAIRQAHSEAAIAMEAEMASIATAIVYGEMSDVQSRYANAIAAYQQSVGTAAKGLMGDQDYFNEMANAAARDGFLLAGAWFMRMSALMETMMEALADAPTAMPIEAAPSMMASDMNRYYAAMAGAVKDSSGTGLDNQLLADREREDSQSGIVTSAINSIFNKIATSGFKFLSDSDSERHPLLVAQSAGSSMIQLAIALAVASIAVSALSVTLAMVLASFVIVLLGAGGTLCYFLPMMPFIIWVSACASWLLTVIEAVLGVSLFAVAHLRPSGSQEFHGGASAGYMLLLDLLVKPVLMVFGLCFAILVSLPLGQFINKIFYESFQLSQGQGGFVSFFGMLTAVTIYTTMMISIMKFTFGFIHKIPDGILKWIGGGHGSGLAEAGSAGSSVEHQSSAAVSAVTGAVAGVATSKLSSMARGEKTNKAADKATTTSHKDSAANAHSVETVMRQKEATDRGMDTKVEDAFNSGQSKNDG